MSVEDEPQQAAFPGLCDSRTHHLHLVPETSWKVPRAPGGGTQGPPDVCSISQHPLPPTLHQPHGLLRFPERVPGSPRWACDVTSLGLLFFTTEGGD